MIRNSKKRFINIDVLSGTKDMSLTESINFLVDFYGLKNVYVDYEGVMEDREKSYATVDIYFERY